MEDDAEKSSQASEPPPPSAVRTNGRDVVVCPWPGGWAVLRVGGKRPGRVRALRDEAMRFGLGFAREARSRLYVADEPIDLEALNARYAEGQEDAAAGSGELAFDGRNPPSRADKERMAKIERVIQTMARGTRL